MVERWDNSASTAAPSRWEVTFGIEQDTEKRSAREALAAGPIRLDLTRPRDILVQRGGAYFAESSFRSRSDDLQGVLT